MTIRQSRRREWLPILSWARTYRGETFVSDALAALIVTIMLIPQSLAYAMLAGLPPEVGLYASILPLVAYAVFGTSRTLAVGPVAVVSLLTAAAVGQVAEQGTAEYLSAAVLLAVLSGGILLLMGLFRLGFLANFLSHPVISGFITASGLIIAASQLKHIFGIDAHGENLFLLVSSLVRHIGDLNVPTLIIGACATLFLFWVRKGLAPLLTAIGLPAKPASMIAKAGPVLAIAVTVAVTSLLRLDQQGVAIVGEVDGSLPPLSIPSFDLGLIEALFVPALLISIIGFVESISVAQTLAAKRRQRIDPDQELIALGASNLAAGFSSGFPVTGGFARSAVNFDAGAETPAAGAFTAIGIAIAALFLTPLLTYLPKATLAATIIVAVLSLVNFRSVVETVRYSKSDGLAMIATILVTLGFGVEAGVVTGVALSLLLFLLKTSRPHMAVVGLVPGTEHFRNIDRHQVLTGDKVITLRVDESLYFANARGLEDTVYDLVAANPKAEHFVLMCPAVNTIDASALESLEAINARLKDAGVTFHLSEVKGPVMDRLKRSHFLDDLTGKVFLSQYDALRALDPEIISQSAVDALCDRVEQQREKEVTTHVR
ncbi:SulP family inorganic anion transporter [Parvularcula lutaonensis]|uniref:SulP family inorganic anion transporter n=1 Tax=Parvularcula lutaonensis TaxID=491923 RepID=A0ABV7MC30_9PROT|nr:sulfate permease [Parvularcula lutaonensis]GGY49349.1 sodium-independent anion transporter [Parvularcula lutaonensis]